MFYVEQQTDGKAVYPGSGGPHETAVNTTTANTKASTNTAGDSFFGSSATSSTGNSTAVQEYTPRSNVLNLPQDTKVHPAGFHRYVCALLHVFRCYINK
jgi:hypothetical protein